MAATKPVSNAPKRRSDKASNELEAFEDISDDVIESDFVPYACLLDAATIATKDGELVQTIKITGLSYDGHSQGSLRDTIRGAVKKALPDDSYAIWLHTLRRKQAAQARPHYPDAFSGKIDESWRSLQPTSISFVNELYITIVKAGLPVSLKHKGVFRQSLRPKHDQQMRLDALEYALTDLTDVTTSIISLLAAFGARQLTTVERDGVFYSEQLEFLEKLINLEERPMPLPERDLSQVLTSGEITFGFNAMEVRTADGVRRFASILTLKEYKESTLTGIDKFLEIPCEIIVSQSFDFTGGNAAHEAYEKQARYLTYSGDKELAQWMEIDRLMGTKESDSSKSFGQQQTTIFLIATSVNQLEANVRLVQRSLNRLGMIVIREDLRFEDCYWSQLPANFAFIARKHPIDTDHLAGFVNLQAAPMGNAAGSPWGPPVTTFTTLQDAPYFFNLHRQSFAHTILLGKPGSGRTTFAHFLLAQARKLPVTLWYLDAHGRGQSFIEAMGGSYLKPGTQSCMLNPLLLPDTLPNREFLTLWLATLIDPTALSLNRAVIDYLQSIIAHLLQLPRDQRRMTTLYTLIRDADSLLAAPLQRFVAGGAYGDLFDMPEDNFVPTKLSGWNISAWMSDPVARVPLTGYLLHRLSAALDGSPTIMVLDDAFRILDTPVFSARIGGWCDGLTQKNAAAFLMTDTIEDSATRPYTASLSSKAATIFAMADREPEAGYMTGFGFTAEDMASLAVLDGRSYQLLQKRGNESVVMKAALNALPPDTMQILRGTQATAKTINPADTLAALMGYSKQAV